MSLLAALRPIVELLPPVANAYRWTRDWLSFSAARPRPTGLGFSLAGPAEMTEGRFEPDIVALVAQLLGDADRFVDVGSNVGYYACLARSRGVPVIAVEPLATNLRLLRLNLAENGWDDVVVVPSALGAAPGVATLHGGSTGASLIEGWAGASHLMRQPVEVTTLDGLLGSSLGRDRLLIKIDVEGGEEAVLAGARAALLARPAPAWIVEIGRGELHPGGQDRFVETVGMFLDAGYLAWTAGPERRRVSREDLRSGKRYTDGNGNYLFIAR